MTEIVNVGGELEDNGGRQIIEKRRPSPHTITLPLLKTCTTSTRSDSLQVSIIKNDTAAGVLQEGAVPNDMSQVITKGTESVWTVVRGMAEVVAKRTVVAQTMILGVAWGVPMTVGAFIFGTMDTKMPKGMAVKTNSFWSCCHGWAQVGILRDNSSRV